MSASHFAPKKKVDNAICADFLAPFPAIYCSATHFYCKQCSAKLQNETICGVLDTAHILLLQSFLLHRTVKGAISALTKKVGIWNLARHPKHIHKYSSTLWLKGCNRPSAKFILDD